MICPKKEQRQRNFKVNSFNQFKKNRNIVPETQQEAANIWDLSKLEKFYVD